MEKITAKQVKLKVCGSVAGSCFIQDGQGKPH